MLNYGKHCEREKRGSWEKLEASDCWTSDLEEGEERNGVGLVEAS